MGTSEAVGLYMEITSWLHSWSLSKIKTNSVPETRKVTHPVRVSKWTRTGPLKTVCSQMAEPRLGQVHQDTTTDPTMHPASFPQTVINRAGKVGSRVQNTQRSHHHGLGLQCAIYTTVIRRTWCLTAACCWFCSSFSLLSIGKPFLFIVMRNGVHVSSKTINLNASYCHWPTVSSFDMISTTDSGAPALLSHSSSKDTSEWNFLWVANISSWYISLVVCCGWYMYQVLPAVVPTLVLWWAIFEELLRRQWR